MVNRRCTKHDNIQYLIATTTTTNNARLCYEIVYLVPPVGLEREVCADGPGGFDCKRVLHHAVHAGDGRGVREQHADGHVRVPGRAPERVVVPVELQADLVHELEGLLERGADVAHVRGPQILELAQERVLVGRLVPAHAHAAVPGWRLLVAHRRLLLLLLLVGLLVVAAAGNEHEVVLVPPARVPHALDEALDRRLGQVQQRHARARALVHRRARVDHERHQHRDQAGRDRRSVTFRANGEVRGKATLSYWILLWGF